MPVSEGYDLDALQPEQAHEGYGTTLNSLVSTNESINTTQRSVWFAHEIPRPPPHKPNLTMPEIANLEESGLSRSGRSRKPTQQAKESIDSTVRKMFGLFTMMSLATVSNLQSAIPEPMPQIDFVRGLKDLDHVNTLFDNAINFFHAMVFAANRPWLS